MTHCHDAYIHQQASMNQFDMCVNLTHCPLEDEAVISKVYFLNALYKRVASAVQPLQNYSQGNATKPHYWDVNIGSGNGLVLSGSKPLSELILTQINVTI